MSSSEAETDDLPDAKTCEDRCQLFANITGTDTALGMFYLQDRSWDLQKSVNAYFEENGDPSQETQGDNAASTQSKDNAKDKKDSAENATASGGNAKSDTEPHRIRVMSWNIDGLDDNNIKNRTMGVCKTIQEENPDVVFLQEVINTSLEMIEENCPLYQMIPAGHSGYFAAMMLKVGSVEYKEHTIKPFFTSLMSRNLLKVQAKVKGVDCTLMTSHLESTKTHGTERKNQLKAAFKEMMESPKENTVVFGGDLNIRDKEIQEVGGIPDKILDVWEVTGKRPEAKFTWDLMRNDNLSWDQKFKPRSRFDRLYIRHPVASAKKLKPVYFELIGIERLQSCQRFPSDHWGILSHYNIT